MMRPNVLVIMIDTLRQDALGCTGNERDLTPNLDRLAAEGVLFTEARSPSSWTLPAHASFFSSSLPSQHGVIDKSRRLPDHFRTLTEELQAAGWRTGAFTDGGFVLPLYGFMKGFDWIHVSPDAAGKRGERFGIDHLSKRALSWIRRKPGPFFTFLHTYEVHSPLDPPEDLREQFVRPYEGPLPRVPVLRKVQKRFDEGEMTPEDLRYLHDLYSAEVAYTDRILGTFLDALEADGVLDSTLVIVTSDHGENFGEHGHLGHGSWLHESLLKVPLILRFPGVYDGGAREDTPVQLLDLAPSILELAELPAPDGWVGASLRRLDAPRDFLASVSLSEKRGLPGASLEERTAHALRQDSIKWLRYGTGFALKDAEGDGATVSRFDLETDPQEQLETVDEQSLKIGLLLFEEILGAYSSRGVAERSKHSDVELSKLKALGYTE